MSAPRNDGGPAFPRRLPNVEVPVCEALDMIKRYEGMSLRDYFAIHCGEPCVAETAAIAGLVMRPDGCVYPVDGDAAGIDSHEWWAGLSGAEQRRLTSIARYAMADALLLARQS